MMRDGDTKMSAHEVKVLENLELKARLLENKVENLTHHVDQVSAQCSQLHIGLWELTGKL